MSRSTRCDTQNQPRGRGPLAFGLLLVSWALLSVACGGGSSDFAQTPVDVSEAFPGGDTTVFNTSDNAFGFPAANLVGTEADDFFVGNSFFRQNWVAAPASAQGRDGLGPLFNAASCSACHFKDGRSPTVSGPGEIEAGLLFKLTLPGTAQDGAPIPDPNYGEQLATAGILGVAEEGWVDVVWTEVPGTYGDGTPYSLRRPTFTVMDLAYGPLDPQVIVAPRIAPAVFGLGLLEAIPEADILALADPNDLDADGIAGRANFVPNLRTGTNTLGRFGWKATQPTVEQQSTAAFLNDIGITSELFPNESCEAGQTDCLSQPSGGAPELEPIVLETLTFYMRTLAVPGRRNWTDLDVARGKEVFGAIGCASCHTPMHTTAATVDIPQLAGQRIYPYTDLLLHDMGPDLADGHEAFEAGGRDWRTPPLWGLGLVPNVNGHLHLLHDGRARGFAEAILWHGGEAENAREAFRNLPLADREALIRFLEDL